MREYKKSKLYKTDVSVEKHIRETFPYKHPLHQDQIMEKIKSGALLGYFLCDIKVPDLLREKFANLVPIFKNKIVCRQVIGPLMQEYAEKKGYCPNCCDCYFLALS